MSHPFPRSSIRRSSHTFLLAMLLLLLALRPIYGAEVGVFPVVNLVLTLVLVAGVFSASESRAYLVLALCLAVPSILLRWSADALEHPWAVTAHLSLTSVFVLLTTVTVLISVLRSREVTSDTVVGGIAVYLLIGVGFAALFTLTEHVAPGSFTGPAVAGAESMSERRLFGLFLYYSFVTLTTLGYGDITPVGEVARNLAAVEAVIGQLFIAIFIARLVGLHISQSQGRPE
jgi:hypothetical protein